MSESKELDNNSPENTSPENKADATTALPEAPHKRDILPEEAQFDKAVYGGISYFAQAAAGIVLTRWLAYGGGKQHFDKVVEKIGEKWASTLKIATLVMVGNSFIPPVKWLEDRKAKIIRGMHEHNVAKQEAAGHPQTPEEKAHDAQALADLDKEPVQSWQSLLEGRAAGLGPVFAVDAMIGNARTEAIQNAAVTGITGGLEKMGLKELAASEKLASYIRVGFLDVFYSAISAGGLYVWSHFIKPPPQAIVDSDAVEPAGNPGLTTGTTLPEAITAEAERPSAARFQDRVKPRTTLPAPETLHTQKLGSESPASPVPVM